MNQIREIERLNERELREGIPYEHSWHGTYKNSAYIFIGGNLCLFTTDSNLPILLVV
jgi:hypothetical protein